jgi:hypothetical protein
VAEVGDLVTPAGRLVVGPDALGGEAWLSARGWRGHTIGPHSLGYCIGSSDVPSILDLPGVGTPAHVYRRKVYAIEEPVNEPMRWGNVFEAAIAGEWCSRNRAVIDEIGLVARDGMPWRQSTIDRRVRECPVHKGSDIECGLEVKHVEYVHEPRWRTANGLPDRITAQIVDQLLNTGYDHIHFAVKVPGDFKQGIVYASREQQLMTYIDAEVERFRMENLVLGVEPAWNLDKADKMIAMDEATHPVRTGVLDIDSVGDVMAYAAAARRESDAAAEKKKLAAALRQHADGAEVVSFCGERAYWYGETTRKKTDLEKLQERWPQAYEECVTEATSHTLYIDKAYKVKGDRA